MDTIIVENTIGQKEWEDFIFLHEEANFLHSWHWGEFYENLNQKVQRSAFYKNKKLVGAMLSIVEEAKRGQYLIVPGGPIIDWQDPEIVGEFVRELRKIAILNNCSFARVRPQLTDSRFSESLFKKLGFTKAAMHLHAELTSQLDITKTEEELLKQMRKTTRHEIKKAEKEKIKIVTSQDPKEMKNFYDLQLETANRQKFTPFAYEYLHEQFKVFAKNKKAILYKAYFKNKLLALAFIIFYGEEAVYHYGASTQEERDHPGAYLIQWRAILEAKKRGMKRYNFWGVAPLEKTNHRFYGLSIFKRGFGGEDVRYLHAQDFIINYPKYFINYAVETMRKFTRKL